MVGELEAQIVAHIEADGPIGFDELQAQALYAPGLGFYTSGGGAGRRRDFLTSPEVGPLFGAVVAAALDGWWAELGRPDPYVVVEAGAGPGTLARSILAADLECAPALRLVLVEPGVAQWGTHPEGGESRVDLPGVGELTDGPVVVLANELLDNLPVAIVERAAPGWTEVVVAVEGGRLVEGHRALDATHRRWCDERAPGAAVGARIPVQAHAAAWLAEARRLAAGGRVVVIDYARTTAELAALPMGRWLRTYARHGAGADPLERLGEQDITCDVAIDQLALVAEPTRVRTQADWLREHGIERLVEQGAAVWRDRGLAGGLAAIAGRSRASEADALLDPAGLGAFTVVEWT